MAAVQSGKESEQEARRTLSVYRDIAALDVEHHVGLVQQQYSGRIYVKKELQVYNRSIYEYLRDHPVANMPRIIDLAEPDGTLTVIEEYLSGQTLQERLDTYGPMAESEVRELMLQLCRILKELHGADPAIIHRDIKPGNLILSPDGVLKLLDVNAARWYDPEQAKDTRILGTVGYAAPEQFGFGQSGAPADIYAVGVLMNMLLTGQMPNDKLPEGTLGPIIRRCTAMDPKARYQTAAELEQALLAAVSGTKAAPNGQTEQSWRRFLPPGFRAGSLPGTFLAVLGYGAVVGIAWLAAREGATLKTRIIDRASVAMIGLFLILFSGNYLNVQAQLPLTRSKNPILRVLGILLYDALAVFAIAFLCAALTS